jgi:hypothetical protein
MDDQFLSSQRDETSALRPGVLKNKDAGRVASPCQFVEYPALKGGD